MFTHGCSFAQDQKADGHGLKRRRASVRTLLWHIERHIDLDRGMGAHELETCSLPNVNFLLAHSLVKWNANWSWIYGCKDQDLLIYYNILLLLCETHSCLLMGRTLHRTDQISDMQQPKPISPHRTVLFFGGCKIQSWTVGPP